MIAQQIGEGVGADDAEVLVGIETDRGPWVRALLAGGYTVFGVTPLPTGTGTGVGSQERSG